MKYTFLIVLYFSVILGIFADAWNELAIYTMDDEAEYVPQTIHDLIIQASPEEMIIIEKRFISILNDINSTKDSKEYSLRMLSRIGSEEVIPVVTKYLNDDRLAIHARSCLEKHCDSSLAEKALLGALSRVKDPLKIGIIASLLKISNPNIEESILLYTTSQNVALANAANRAVSKLRENALREERKYHTQLSDKVLLSNDQLLDTIANITKEPDKQRFIRHLMEEGTSNQKNCLISYLPRAPQSDQMTILGAIHDLKLYQYENEVLMLFNNSLNDVHNQTIYTLGVIGKERSFQRLYAAYQENEKPSLVYAISQLQLPAVDKHLLYIVSGDSKTNNLESRIAAILPLALRNPKGTAKALDPLIKREQPRALRMAALKAIEYAGDTSNCTHLCNLIANTDPLTRQLQLTLKRTALRVDKSNEIWNKAFKPILANDDVDDEIKKLLIAIIDGVPGKDTIEYLKTLIIGNKNSLRPLAIRALQKWPNHLSGNLWVEIASSKSATESEIKLALKGITRILSRVEIEKDTNRRLKLALLAIQNAPNTEYKIQILHSLEESNNYAKKRMKIHFLPIINDPHIGKNVRELMGSS